jgi:hypothetical protein
MSENSNARKFEFCGVDEICEISKREKKDGVENIPFSDFVKQVAKNQNISEDEVIEIFKIINEEMLKFIRDNKPKVLDETVNINFGLFLMSMIALENKKHSRKCIGINSSLNFMFLKAANEEIYGKMKL